ncbi:hypothetical protein CEXT_683901 [Caerostris extrusa]|uniref:Uncharacterized protein n=1 Tax=Caerostris extrusa TaxID=172846 RepID=A0AAV4S221_CAEEX|nr:hypothetical protein CEXT_683901 [Caerostris extrusa]
MSHCAVTPLALAQFCRIVSVALGAKRYEILAVLNQNAKSIFSISKGRKKNKSLSSLFLPAYRFTVIECFNFERSAPPNSEEISGISVS